MRKTLIIALGGAGLALSGCGSSEPDPAATDAAMNESLDMATDTAPVMDATGSPAVEATGTIPATSSPVPPTAAEPMATGSPR